MTAVRKNGKPKSGHKNPVLTPGIYRFGRSKMFHKKGLWAKKHIKNPKKVVKKKPIYLEKKVGGDKNGGTRKVMLQKSKKYHPTAIGKKGVKSKSTRPRKTRLRGSLVPGAVCIIVAGRHAGKRVVMLKQLESGLVLVTGPFKVNSVPLRRYNQRYLIGTSTRIDMSKVSIPEKFTDEYFRRDKKTTQKLRKQQMGNIFASQKGGYEVSETRKKDQVEFDKTLIAAIKTHPEKKALFKYLGSPFYLRTGQVPHRMKF